jgi:ABC-type bacteriocin/lantibiotic exporter with double-glycine peptidase domain
MTIAKSSTATQDPAPWSSTLQRFTELTETLYDPARLAEAARHLAQAPEARLDALVTACDGLGMQVTAFAASAEVALERFGNRPLVVLTGDGDPLIVQRGGARVRVEWPSAGEARWMSVSDLGELVAGHREREVAWLGIEARPDMETLRSEHDTPGGEPGMSPIARVRRLLVTERRDVSVVVLYGIAIGLLGLATPVAVQALVNTVAFGTLIQPLVVLAILLFAGLSLAAVFRALQTWVVEVLQRRLFLRVVSDLAVRLPRVDVRAVDGARGAELVNRFFDVFTVQKAAAELLLGGLEVVLTASVGLILLAIYHPVLMVFDIALILSVALILFVLGRGGTKSAITESKTKYAVAEWLEEMARYPVYFKHAGGGSYAQDRTDALARSYLVARGEHFRVLFRQILGALGLQAVASTGLLAVGGALVLSQQLTLGQLVAAELIVASVVASLAKLGKHLEGFYDLVAAVDKLGQLVDLPLENESTTEPATPAAEHGALELRGLRFAHAGGDYVLRDVSLNVQPGEHVAIGGGHGSGKSTLADLLFGLRRASQGWIRLDGIDFRNLRLEDLRSRVALVRRPEILRGTVLDNIRVGRPYISQADIFRALDIVGLTDELLELPNGLHTWLNVDDPVLSRGRAMRLTIARALAGRPSVLVLDEVLDSLEQSCRTKVLDRLFDEEGALTVVVTTDDDSIRMRCDRVFSLEQGTLRPCPPPPYDRGLTP